MYRELFNLLLICHASLMFDENNVQSFETLIQKIISSFIVRHSQSNNKLINTLYSNNTSICIQG